MGAELDESGPIVVPDRHTTSNRAVASREPDPGPVPDTDMRAFPLEYTESDRGESWKASHYGMTLRDYYAGKALQGICALETMIKPESAAEAAYDYADAMMRERTKRG